MAMYVRMRFTFICIMVFSHRKIKTYRDIPDIHLAISTVIYRTVAYHARGCI
ncbi:hypothetical protein Bhyg_03664 [Pseudolycoriella hygida]|uniref:Uncharacterized protein n=1 Tax=Pseudolycoriella hygida TaxID=35572 RepID=A0A9Q0NF67_9DIPT|nr:hypothetical protein Bhyg_03664 [Pseudolycoriella hygida]